MSYIVVGLFLLVFGLGLFGEFSGAFCPECKKFGLRFNRANDSEKTTVVLSSDGQGRALYKGTRVKTETTFKCKHCSKVITRVEERLI